MSEAICAMRASCLLRPVSHQPNPLHLAAFAEQHHRLRHRHRRLDNRRIGRDDLPHARLDPLELGLRERIVPLDLAEVAADG